LVEAILELPVYAVISTLKQPAFRPAAKLAAGRMITPGAPLFQSFRDVFFPFRRKAERMPDKHRRYNLSFAQLMDLD
jgi:hypothetical protein